MRIFVLATLLVATVLSAAVPAGAQGFRQVNLVSDLSGMALHQDTHLVNPWGLAPGPTGVFWVSNNGTGTSTLYDPDGTPHALVVSIPDGDPTGVAVTAPTDSAFRIMQADTAVRALFVFVTEHGVIAAWGPGLSPNTAAARMDSVAGASYTGVAIGGTAAAPRLYAANFGQGRIDVFDRDFAAVSSSGSFTDSNLPAGYAPFNVANVGGQILVAYALKDTSGDEVHGAGLGFVDAYDMNGALLRRIVSNGDLNAPWAMVMAPSGFGSLGGDLLVGNLGSGRIDAYTFSSGAFAGTLDDTTGAAVSIPGIWGLHFGAQVSGPDVAMRLYFAAGIQDEAHGLFGYFAPAQAGPGPGPGPVVCTNNPKGLGWWRKQCGGPDNGHGGNGQGHRPDGSGHGDGHGHGPKPGMPADSLHALLACVSGAGAPNAFGSGGCFTAGCDLLQKVGRRSERELAAQALLAVRLDLCAGVLCDTLRLTCTGDNDLSVRVLTVGEVADSLDAALCDGASAATVRSLRQMLACLDAEDEGGDEPGDDDGGMAVAPRLGVHPIVSPARLSAGAVQFAVTADQPAVVRLRIYDAAGRLVAEPMRGALVSGTMNVAWDTRDLQGRLVTPGTYFYRATGAATSASGRIVVLR